VPSHSSAIERPAVICVRAPNWVGDVVMATPTFRCLREAFPGSRIVLIIRDKIAAVVQGAAWFDKVMLCRPAGGGRATIREFLRCTAGLREEGCDLGFLLPNSFSSALMFALGRVRRRVGYRRDARGLLLTLGVDRPSREGRFRPAYMVDFYLALCEAAGLRCTDRRMELPYDEEDAARARKLLRVAGVSLDRPLVLLHAGAGYGPSKRWAEENWARLAEGVKGEFGAQPAFIGAPPDAETVARVRRVCRTELVDLTSCGIDLHLLKPVVGACSLLVTTDSGPRHYGVALGVPTVCLMGPTHPDYSTSGLPHDRVVRVDVECGPCQKKTCRTDHRCMTLLTPQMVLEACRPALEAAGGAKR